MKKNLLVLFGGESSEHDVSQNSAYNVIKAINTEEYNVYKIGITSKGVWYLYEGDIENIRDGSWEKENNKSAFINPCKSVSGITVRDNEKTVDIKIDVCFPVLHGKNGEDGTIQGLLTLAGIKFVGCSYLASSLCMDKVMTKIIIEKNDIPQTPYVYITKGEDEEQFIKKAQQEIGFPCFVKPANAGSSIGASRADDKKALKKSLKEAFLQDKKVLVEKYIDCKEIETAVMGNVIVEVAGPGEIVSDSGFYDYETKYISTGNAKYNIPADLPFNILSKISELAKKAYKVLDCKGMARVDFFVDKVTNEIYLNEVNTIPGFTDSSMYPKLFESEGVSYNQIVSRLINLASL